MQIFPLALFILWILIVAKSAQQIALTVISESLILRISEDLGVHRVSAKLTWNTIQANAFQSAQMQLIIIMSPGVA